MASDDSTRLGEVLAADLDPATLTPERLTRATRTLAETATQLADAVVAYCATQRTSSDVADDEGLPVKEVATLWHVPATQIRRLIDRGELRAVYVGRYPRVLRADLRAYAAAHRTPPGDMAQRLASQYSSRHDQHRPPPSPTAPEADASAAGRTSRHSADVARALGARRQSHSPARRDRADAARRARDSDPLDVGAADAFAAPPEG